MGPPDPILGVTVAFRNDPHPDKLNLGVGAYRDDNGNPFVLSCVKQAEGRVIAKNLNHEYTPIGGTPEFTSMSAKLLFEPSSPLIAEGRVASVQTLSGTGALRVAGEFCRRFISQKEIYVPQPTWGNHIPIFKNSGFDIKYYKYYDGKGGLDFEGLKKDVSEAADGSFFLFHACAHNPTGVDPNKEQWQELATLCKQKNHLVLFDSAYQGFASGDTESDAFSLRHFCSVGVPVIATQSFAKNFGLYGERIGALHVVTSSKEETERVLSQLLIVIRPMYSNPPVYGARLVEEILGDKDLSALWRTEVKTMADRIITMRELLVSNLKKLGSKHDWSHITNQIGMFCYSGLTAKQVEELKDKWHVYMTSNGRISMAGVTSRRVEYLAKAIHDVSK
jgi:aspartate aminotransferase